MTVVYYFFGTPTTAEKYLLLGILKETTYLIFIIKR